MFILIGRVIEWSLDEPRATTTGEPLDAETFFGSESDVEDEDEENDGESPERPAPAKNDETGDVEDGAEPKEVSVVLFWFCTNC
jgi:hypothetical protein